MDKALFSIVFFYYLYIVAFLYYTFTQRKKAFYNKTIDYNYLKTYQAGGTPELVVLQNHFNNQFQMPIFFFITCVVAKLFNTINELTIGLALLFVVSRMFHSYIHLTSNVVLRRAFSYFIGIVVIILMWIQILVAA